MKKIDKDGLSLCELQAQAFESSVNNYNSSSAIFIRRFMNSEIAYKMDALISLESPILPNDILDYIDEEYKPTQYGSVKFTPNEMYWMGYLYRYFSYTYEYSSKKVYKIIKPTELRGYFLAYHTLDCSQAIERILEAKNISINSEEELQREYSIYKKIRIG